MFGITITFADISNSLASFFNMGGVQAIIIGSIALGLVPIIVRALFAILPHDR